MKKFLPVLLIAVTAITSCSKKDGSVTDSTAQTTVAPLSAGFAADNATDLKEGTPVVFHNSSVSGKSYSWDFGNGKTSTDKEPVNNYPSCGTYTVKLSATDAAGNTVTTSHEYIINCIFRAPGQPPVVHAPLF